MRNPKMMQKASVKCAAAILSAVMAMTPVAGAVAMPLVAYAADYSTTNDVPVENGQRNLQENDTLASNTGEINQNAGTITDNSGMVAENTGTVENNSGTVTTNIGTVNNNSGQVTDNYGTVNNTSTQPEGTVGTNHINSRVTGGNTTDNYGNVTNGDVTNNYSGGMVTDNSATVCVVQNNYGTVNGADNVTYNVGSVTGVASVYDNYGTATDCGVDINYSSGTVQGNSTVTQNRGGRLGDGINPTNPDQSADAGTPPTPAAGRATDPTGNPYVAPQAAPVQADPAPEPEQTHEPEPEPAPSPAPASQEKKLSLNELGVKDDIDYQNAKWNGDHVVFRDGSTATPMQITMLDIVPYTHQNSLAYLSQEELEVLYEARFRDYFKHPDWGNNAYYARGYARSVLSGLMREIDYAVKEWNIASEGITREGFRCLTQTLLYNKYLELLSYYHHSNAVETYFSDWVKDGSGRAEIEKCLKDVKLVEGMNAKAAEILSAKPNIAAPEKEKTQAKKEEIREEKLIQTNEPVGVPAGAAAQPADAAQNGAGAQNAARAAFVGQNAAGG